MLDSDAQKFNDDLLANERDRERAAKSYPRLIHVLDHPELQRLFLRYDVPANAAKRRSHSTGLLAIFLGTFALLGASVASLSGNWGGFSTLVGIVTAAAGSLSVLIGLWGVLYGPAKRRWLSQRLMTERLRQFHFQTFVCHLLEIVQSLGIPGGDQTYEKARDRWFNTFESRFVNHLAGELTGILEGRKSADVWLHERTPPNPDVFKADLHDVFEAYKVLRILHQLQYANYKLREEGNLWSASPRKLKWLLSVTVLVLILLLFAIHLIIAFGLALPTLQLTSLVESPWIHVAAIWCAILALAIRAVGEGLGVRDESARYRDYRSSVEAIRERFDQATDPIEKWRIMDEMERLSYEEMCSFLRSGHEATFVM